MSHQNKTSDRELNQKSKNNNFLSQQIGSSNICDNRRGQDLSFTKIWRKKWVKSNTLLDTYVSNFILYLIIFLILARFCSDTVYGCDLLVVTSRFFWGMFKNKRNCLCLSQSQIIWSFWDLRKLCYAYTYVPVVVGTRL